MNNNNNKKIIMIPIYLTKVSSILKNFIIKKKHF